MDKVELLFDNFLEKNSGNKYLKNRTDIVKVVNKVFTLSDIKTSYNLWSEHIPIESVLMGIDGFGGCFIFSNSNFFYKSTSFSESIFVESLEKFLYIGGNPKSDIPPVWGNITYGGKSLGNITTTKTDLFTLLEEFKKDVIQGIINYSIEEQEKLRLLRLEEEKELEKVRLKTLYNQMDSIILELDKNNDGEIDLLDYETFSKLLNKNQQSIIEIDKIFIQKFVKVNIYLKTKKNNIRSIFNSIRSSKNGIELNELVSLLKNQIHTYDSLIFHSISMITSLVKGDLITFYEIYECFDQLGVFNSNWENEVSNKLTNIGDGIKELMYSIYQMENNIVNSIDNLTYVTQDSFNDLQMSISRELQDIDSSIQFNNLLTGIQTYQMYKINQSTKKIN